MFHADDPNGRKDFNNTALKIMFPAGSEDGSIQTVAIEVFDDDIDEYLEGFFLVLDVDTTLTALSASFTSSKRTALVNIYDDDRKFYCPYHKKCNYFILQHFILGLSNKSTPIMKYLMKEFRIFHSVQHQAMQLKNSFLSALIYLQSRETLYGEVSMLYCMIQVLINLCCAIIANGDFSFGSSLQPSIRFSDSIITPFVINDDIIEGEEIGQLRVGFDGSAAPRFQSVRIIIVDDDGMFISACTLIFWLKLQ